MVSGSPPMGEVPVPEMVMASYATLPPARETPSAALSSTIVRSKETEPVAASAGTVSFRSSGAGGA